MGQVTVTLNLQPLEARSKTALKAAVNDLDAAVRKQFTEPKWGWPGTTIRRDGSVAGSERDIVDTGELQRSQQPPVLIAPGHWRTVWTADYAAAVFLGAVFKTGRSLPARNVAYGAFQAFNLAESFAKHWRAG